MPDQVPQVPQFVDRLLLCSDCHGEFVFTAGEQLFFHDKEFKNDPKRCKPCKSRRSGLAAAANGTGPAAAGLSRTETRTTCSECGIETTVPFKPTQGRPVLCRQCFQIKGRAARPVAAAPASELALAASGVPLSPYEMTEAAHNVRTAGALTRASAEPNGMHLSAEAAVLAAASMVGASFGSSVATTAELASITPGERYAAQSKFEGELAQRTAVHVGLPAAQMIPAELLTDAPKA